MAKKPKSKKSAAAADPIRSVEEIEAFLKGSNLGEDFSDMIVGLINDRFNTLAAFSAEVGEEDQPEEVGAEVDETVDADGAEVTAEDEPEAEEGEGEEAGTEAEAEEAEGDPEPEAEEGEEGEGEEPEEAEAEAEVEEAEEPAPAPKKPKAKKGSKKAVVEEEVEEAEEGSETQAPDWKALGVTAAQEKAALKGFNDDAKAAVKFVKEFGISLPKSMTGKKSSDAEKLAFAASVSAAFAALTAEKLTVGNAQKLAKKVLGEEVKTGRTKKPDAIKEKIALALIGAVVAEM